MLLYLLIYLLIYLSSSACTSHEFTTLRELFDIWHALQQSVIDTSAINGERFFAPAYGPKEVILSSDNMLIE